MRAFAMIVEFLIGIGGVFLMRIMWNRLPSSTESSAVEGSSLQSDIVEVFETLWLLLGLALLLVGGGTLGYNISRCIGIVAPGIYLHTTLAIIAIGYSACCYIESLRRR